MAKECSLYPLVNHWDLSFQSWENIFGQTKPLDVEIGFGMGEFLVESAFKNPDRNFVGIEENWERTYKTFKRAERTASSAGLKQLENLRILKMDARITLEYLFKPQSISRIYCLFPCPWPKKGHVKNRLFSDEFMRLVNNRLIPDGKIQLVTDFYPYFQWVREQVDHDLFDEATSNIKRQFNTKFERKWSEEGQENFFEIQLTKKKHFDYKGKKFVEMKTYKLKNFDFKKFDFKQAKDDDAVVVCKDFVFDQKQNIGLARLIVNEQQMSQNLWVSIVLNKDAWFIGRAKGQQFFPTPGIARAIECVYQAAQATVKSV